MRGSWNASWRLSFAITKAPKKTTPRHHDQKKKFPPLKQAEKTNHPLEYTVPPGKLTWNLRITLVKRKNIFQTFIFGFHVKFRGCTCDVSQASTWNCCFSFLTTVRRIPLLTTVDGSEIPLVSTNKLGYYPQTRRKIMGITYQPQLVSLQDFWTISSIIWGFHVEHRRNFTQVSRCGSRVPSALHPPVWRQLTQR